MEAIITATADQEQIRTIAKEALSSSLYLPDGSFQNWYESTSFIRAIAVARILDAAVGCAILRTVPSRWDYNLGVFVSSGHRRQHIGTNLVRAVAPFQPPGQKFLFERNRFRENFFLGALCDYSKVIENGDRPYHVLASEEAFYQGSCCNFGGLSRISS